MFCSNLYTQILNTKSGRVGQFSFVANKCVKIKSITGVLSVHHPINGWLALCAARTRTKKKQIGGIARDCVCACAVRCRYRTMRTTFGRSKAIRDKYMTICAKRVLSAHCSATTSTHTVPVHIHSIATYSRRTPVVELEMDGKNDENRYLYSNNFLVAPQKPTHFGVSSPLRSKIIPSSFGIKIDGNSMMITR